MKPSENEEKFFVDLELKRRLEMARAQQAAMASSERQRLKELHFMRCPKCGQPLNTEQQADVEVDVCSSCRGLWLDASELDHILVSKDQAAPWRRFLKVLGVQNKSKN